MKCLQTATFKFWHHLMSVHRGTENPRTQPVTCAGGGTSCQWIIQQWNVSSRLL